MGSRQGVLAGIRWLVNFGLWFVRATPVAWLAGVPRSRRPGLPPEKNSDSPRFCFGGLWQSGGSESAHPSRLRPLRS